MRHYMERIEQVKQALIDAKHSIDFGADDAAKSLIDAALSALEAEGGTAAREAPEDVAGLVERLTRERKVHLGDIVAVRALLEDVGADAGEAASALTRIAAERDEAREHIRKQAADIMTLGQLVYKDADTTWKAEASTLHARIAELEGALGDLLSWFPDEPTKPEWRLTAGKYGADDAISAARAARRYVEEGK